jgi:hypothetical protein
MITETLAAKLPTTAVWQGLAISEMLDLLEAGVLRRNTVAGHYLDELGRVYHYRVHVGVGGQIRSDPQQLRDLLITH